MTEQQVADEATHAVLHALRIRGAIPTADLARVSGRPDAESLARHLVRDGLVIEQPGYLIAAPDGIARDDEWIRTGVAAQVVELTKLYDARFLDVNVRFKALATDWQENGESIERIEAAAEIHNEISAFLADAAALAPHLARYQARLDSSMDGFLAGDASALLAAVGDSYHSTWFELHEDLLVTLGRSRDEEPE